MSYRFDGKRVFVTGATAGIGQAIAEGFARAGAAEVFVNGRREDRLAELGKRLEDETDATITPVVFDVRDRGAVDAAFGQTNGLADVDLLVNNAGLARGTDPMHEAEPGDWDEMIDTNVKGLLYVTRKVVARMVERGDGHIVNLGSTAGRWVYPGGGVYNATKFAVRALTEGLRMDIHGSGVRVTNIAPGLVETEFSVVRFKGDEDEAAKVYADTRPLVAEDIADAVLWSCSRPAHVNIQEIVVYPTDQAHVGMVHRS